LIGAHGPMNHEAEPTKRTECLEIKKAVAFLDTSIPNPHEGLPHDVFLFVSRVTPLVNVDLLIRDGHGGTLLTWRDDGYDPPGWHVPGGIIRFKETISQRIRAVAATELGAEITHAPSPLAMNEAIHPSRPARGHFLSLLYECTLLSAPDDNLRYEKGLPKPGQWAWHKQCPNDLIPVHEMYRQMIQSGHSS
jgi:ADP-ribose pyrophosphatase YjhB (NUDIX family)